RDRFNLHQEFRPKQLCDLNSGAGRRILDIHVLVTNLSELGQMRKIHKIDVQLDYVVERPTRGPNRRLEILKYLLHLGAEVIVAHYVPRFIEGHLPCNEYNGSPGY